MIRISALALLLVLTCGLSAEAGYIFLKNGYILQGRVSDKDDDKVILNYPGGSVTVERRFVKHVVLDPSEEATHAERRRQATDPAAVDSGEDARLDTNVPLLELPEDLNELIPLNRINVDTEDPATDPSTTTDLVTDVAQIPINRPEVPELATERSFPEVGFVVQPPQNWHVTKEGQVVTFKINGSNDFPSFKVRRFEQQGLSTREAFDKLKETLATLDPDVKILEESEQAIGLERALVVSGELPSKGLMFRQAVVVHRDHLYLIGAQWAPPIDSGQQLALERSLTSIRFAE